MPSVALSFRTRLTLRWTIAFSCILAAASAADYDLAILDVNLRGEETYPVAEIAATHRKPVIFATGYGEQGLPEAWRDRPILQKPFDADALKDAIAAAMRGSAS